LACRLCTWLSAGLCSGSGMDCASFWRQSERWERAHSNEWKLWSEETDENRELIARAIALRESDPKETFRLDLEAANAGSIRGMTLVAWHYDTGTTVKSDFWQAQEYYYRALSAGSWMATIRYAKLLAKHGYYDYCERVLEDGVRADFIPAYFWLAWFRVKQSNTRGTCRQVRHLLEYAAEHGHPGAKLILSRWLLSGRFGLRHIPSGWRAFREFVSFVIAQNEAQKEPPAQTQSSA